MRVGKEDIVVGGDLLKYRQKDGEGGCWVYCVGNLFPDDEACLILCTLQERDRMFDYVSAVKIARELSYLGFSLAIEPLLHVNDRLRNVDVGELNLVELARGLCDVKYRLAGYVLPLIIECKKSVGSVGNHVFAVLVYWRQGVEEFYVVDSQNKDVLITKSEKRVGEMYYGLRGVWAFSHWEHLGNVLIFPKLSFIHIIPEG